MISIVVAAVLLALASPSFVEFTKNRRITAQANEFVSTLSLARSEALKRVSRVTVCASSNGTSCTGGWNQGYLVFNDDNNNGSVDGGESILKVVSALAGANTLNGITGTVASYVSYVSSGHSKLTSGAFQSGSIALCDDRGVSHGRAITVNVTGRVRVESTEPTSCAL
jgi:type IV fimbrial biogenesis protein FimT